MRKNKIINILILCFSIYFIGSKNVLAAERMCAACGDGALAIPVGIPNFVSNLLKLVQILVPILLIIMGIVTFLKAMISGDEKVSKESISTFIRSIILGIAVFLIVAIVKTVFTILGSSVKSNLNCVSCFIDSSTCAIEQCPERVTEHSEQTNTQ